MGVLDNLEPKQVFKYFEEICSIPHGSSNTRKITGYCIDFAKKNQLDYIADELGNVLIKKNAYKGYESAPALLLQGHLDMVCEKNFEYENRFDFTKDPLNLTIMDDFVYAKGTTLGGDDGIAIAYMLAILEDTSLKHPKLECLFTVDEEIGMLGMDGFDTSVIESRRMINIDNETEGEILTSSAGGRMVKCQVPVRYNEKSGLAYDVVICGLLGGHSGQEIDKYRGNANLLMGRLLHYLNNKLNYELYYLKGGLQDNAIPREAKASIMIHEKDANKLEEYIGDFEQTLQNEYKHVEDNLTIYCEEKGRQKEQVLTKKTKERIIFILMTMPDGIVKMCPDMERIVQTSSNAGIMRLKEKIFELIISIRSSISSEKQAMSDKIQFLTETIGGTFVMESDYPAWEYKDKSLLRDIISDSYNELFGEYPNLTRIHAGLECGVIYDKIKDIDIVSIGPNIYDIHTPKEKLSISSTERTWRLICKVMENCI